MEKFIETLRNVENHGYRVEELPGILPFSEEQKRTFLLKQILMRVATGVGEIATLSEPEVLHSNANDNLLKDSIAKLFMNVLRLAKMQNLDEELLYADVQRLLFKA
jgi:hypothetical protein